jgi:hypothetical protein
MEDKAVKSWLDIAPAYINFFIKFLRNPRDAFSKVKGCGEISSDLTTIFIGGIALSYVIVFLGASPNLKEDSGNFVGISRYLAKVDYHFLPVVAIGVILALAVWIHALAKLYSLTGRKEKYDPKLGGTIEDSVNAALGYSAVFIPLFVGLICVCSWVPGQTAILITGTLLITLFGMIYFPWSLSSTHPDTGFIQALFAVGGSIVITYLLVLLANALGFL